MKEKNFDTMNRSIIEIELEKANEHFNKNHVFHYRKCSEILEEISNTNPIEFEENVNAIMNLAECYEVGKGLKKNETRAFELYHLAAEKENPLAMRKVGEAYYYGFGTIQKNYDLAFNSFLEAYENGDITSAIYLAESYEVGKGTHQNYSKAFEYWDKVKPYYPEAAKHLGDFYYYGLGVNKDYVEAVKFYMEGCGTNHVESLKKLSDCYYKGVGVERKRYKAAWYSFKAMLYSGVTFDFSVHVRLLD